MALPFSCKYRENVLDTDKSATNACKIASKRMIKKTAVPRVDLVGNKIAEKITKAATKDNHDEDLKKSLIAQIPESTSKPKEMYIPPEK